MSKPKYLVLGSNNFWYALCYTKKEAIAIANDLKSEEEYEKCDFGDPESNYHPNKPDAVHIYKIDKLINN